MSNDVVVLAATGAQCCSPITEASLEPAQAVDLARMFKALGDPVRLRLLSRITAARDGEICVCDITGDAFEVSGPTVSHHLKVLREAGLIAGERRGTWVYYRPVAANLRRLATVLDAPVAYPARARWAGVTQ
jgi:ArsR family transcriptional regulator